MAIKEVIKKESTAEFVLSSGHLVKIDIDYLTILENFSWHINAYGYVVAGIWNADKKNNDIIYMHRYILSAPKNKVVDHIDGDPLNNTRENLRLANKMQNGQNRKYPGKANSSGVIGVEWDKKRGLWVAKIKVNNKGIYLGSSEDKEKAILLRKNAEAFYFGEFRADNA